MMYRCARTDFLRRRIGVWAAFIARGRGNSSTVHYVTFHTLLARGRGYSSAVRFRQVRNSKVRGKCITSHEIFLYEIEIIILLIITFARRMWVKRFPVSNMVVRCFTTCTWSRRLFNRACGDTSYANSTWSRRLFDRAKSILWREWITRRIFKCPIVSFSNTDIPWF